VAAAQLGEDALVEALEVPDRFGGGAAGAGGVDRPLEFAELGGAPRAVQLLDRDAGHEEGTCGLAAVGDLSEEAVARQTGQRCGLGPPAPLLRDQPGGAGVERGGEQVRAVGGDRVQRLLGEPLGVLVEQERPHAVLRGLLEQRREVARGGAVVGLDLVEEDPERSAVLGSEVGAALGGVQQVEDEQVGDEAVAGSARARTGEHDQPTVHRLAHPVARLALAEQGGDRRRGPQPVDQVGDRGDRLLGEPRKAIEPEALGGAREEGQRGAAPLLVGEQRRQLEDGRRELGRQDAGDRREGLGGLGREVDRAGVSLVPAKRRGERVDHRLDPVLGRAGLSRCELEDVPGWLALGRAAAREVDLDHPLAQSGLCEVVLDPLDGVLVGIEEETAVARANEVQELGDGELGLAVAGAPGAVAEEGVGDLNADEALARVRGDATQWDQLGLTREGRERWRRWGERTRAHDVVGAAAHVRRLQEPRHLARRDEAAAGGVEEAAPHPVLEPPAPPGQVGAEEREAGDRAAGDAQPVAVGELLEGREQGFERDPDPGGICRLAADEDLQLEERTRVLQLRVERPGLGAPLGEIDRLGPSIPLATEPVERAGAVGVKPARLAQQPPAQAAALEARRREQVDADERALPLSGAKRPERSGEGLQGVGVEREPCKRFDARPGQHQLGADHRPIARFLLTITNDPGGIAQLHSLVGAHGAAQQLARATRDLDQVGEPPVGIGFEPDANGAGALVEPAADTPAQPRELGGEAKDRLGGGIELIGWDNGHADPRAESPAGDHQTQCEQPTSPPYVRYRDFLAADPRRRGDAFELGHQWRDGHERYRVCWYEETGELTAERLAEDAELDLEDFHKGVEGPVEVLAHIETREELERLLGPWPQPLDERSSLPELRALLRAGAGSNTDHW